MADTAGWLALVATSVAALMTAANLGPRATGWGFVVFTAGAGAWIIVGLATHQQQLLYSNLFLGCVNVFGIWRWLGHRARISDTSEAEEARSCDNGGEKLFSTAKLDGLPVNATSGEVLATSVDALAACEDGHIDFLLVRVGGVGGVGETLHRLPWSSVTVGTGSIVTSLSRDELLRLPAASTA